MHRWIAIVAVAAVVLFAASFAMARSGRPQAERSPARTDSAPAALERVKTASGVGKLRRLDPRSLPALKREPVKPPDDDNRVTPPISGRLPPDHPAGRQPSGRPADQRSAGRRPAGERSAGQRPAAGQRLRPLRLMLEPGTDIGAYRIEGLLGRGGMGVVYEATQHSLGRKVALKLLAADLSLDESFRSRFRREGRIQAGLDHAHIVPIYEAGELEEHGLFIAMRLVRGSTLKELIKRRRARRRARAACCSSRSPTRSTPRTRPAWSTATSSRRTSSSGGATTRTSPTSASRRAPSDTGVHRDRAVHGDARLHRAGADPRRARPARPATSTRSRRSRSSASAGTVPFPKPTEAAVMFAHMSDPPPRASEVRPALPAAVDEVLAARAWRSCRPSARTACRVRRPRSRRRSRRRRRRPRRAYRAAARDLRGSAHAADDGGRGGRHDRATVLARRGSRSADGRGDPGGRVDDPGAAALRAGRRRADRAAQRPGGERAGGRSAPPSATTSARSPTCTRRGAQHAP